MATGSLQEAISSLQVYYNEYKGVLNELFGFSIEGPNISHLLQSFGGGAVKFLIGMIAGIYLLKDKDFFLRLMNKAMHLLLGQKVHGVVREILFEINDVISAFLRGVFVDSVIVAFLSSPGSGLHRHRLCGVYRLLCRNRQRDPLFWAHHRHHSRSVGRNGGRRYFEGHTGSHCFVCRAASGMQLHLSAYHRQINWIASALCPNCCFHSGILWRPAVDGAGSTHSGRGARLNL